jgi:branched-chain amino acid transport system substrate-binding protein
VLGIMGSLGTATNLAVQRYLNGRQVPQVLIATGVSHFNDPKQFPWTVPFLPLYTTYGAAFANYLLQNKPDAKVALLYQNDDYGKDYIAGFKQKLGAPAAQMIVAQQTYEVTDPSIDSQIVQLHGAGADVLIDIANGKFTAQAIRKTYDLDWHPLHFLADQSISPATVLKPAGLEKSIGLMTATYAKSPGDPTWADDPAWKDYLAFMARRFPGTDPNDQYAYSGWSTAHVFADVLRQCGDELTRENLLKVVTHLRGVRGPHMLPGITVDLAPDDYRPFKKVQFQRFDGASWVLIGGLVEG